MSRTARAWGVNLMLLATAILLTLGGFEATLRIFLPQKTYRFPRGLFQNSPDRVYGLTPGFRGVMHNPEFRTQVRINSLGFRGEEVTPKRPGAKRLLVVGDSFVSAFNVEEKETFASVLGEELLRDPQGGAMEVVNAGTPGYGTWQELQALRELQRVVQPDLTVLAVFVGNDLADNLSPKSVLIRDGFIVDRQPTPGIIPVPVRSWLQRNSMAYVFLWNAWDRIRPLFGKAPVDPLQHFKSIVSREPDPQIEEAYRISRDILFQFADAAKQGGFPVLVVLIPDELQVYPERFVQRVKAEGLDPSKYDFDLPDRRWSDLAREAGLPVLDLLPVFRSRTQGPHLYMSLDGHLTVLGNRIAGEAIRDAVRPLLPPREAAR